MFLVFPYSVENCFKGDMILLSNITGNLERFLACSISNIFFPLEVLMKNCSKGAVAT